jgi:hypothetical protein
VFVNPRDGQTVGLGEPAEFFVSTRGYERFDSPISLAITQWNTQRFPNPHDPSTLPLQLTFPATISPGQTATVHVETTAADTGIYFITLQASGEGITQTVDLSLVVRE